jgi:hypothetical protein
LVSNIEGRTQTEDVWEHGAIGDEVRGGWRKIQNDNSYLAYLPEY